MHVSGLLIRTLPESIEDCARELSRCPGFDVCATDAEGRIVAVLETRTAREQEDGLRRAQSLPHVISAELVYHYFGDADDPANESSTEEES